MATDNIKEKVKIDLSNFTPKSKKVYREGKQVLRVKLESKKSNSK